MRFLRNCLTLEVLSASLEGYVRGMCHHYGWHEQEMDDWIGSPPTSCFFKETRPDLTLSEEKAKKFMTNTVLEEIGKLDKIYSST